MEKVRQLKRRLAKEFFGALAFEDKELALDSPDRRFADVAVGSGQAAGIFGNEGEQGAQIFQVEQQEPLVVGELESGSQHSCLNVVQLQQARQQQRSHFRNGRPDRVSLLAQKVPVDGRKAAIRI